tara:strand:+ start:1961 stop:2581 length:621 start_codon:yes stop_codon:yes gene_type:complete
MNDNINDLEKVFGKLVDKYEAMSSDATLDEMIDLTKEIDQVDLDYKEQQMKNNIAGFNENLKIELKFQNKSDNEDPSFVYKLDSGFDLRASEGITIQPKEVGLVPTGISLEIPKGFEVQVRSRSGLSLKEGLFVLNSPGTIDQGYIGEIKIILANFSSEERIIGKGDRIAQACLCPVVTGEYVELINNKITTQTDRGADGFGSTGK